MFLWSTDYIFSSHVLTSMMVLLLYDLWLTFNDEILDIWLQPWTMGTFMFAVNRYMPFVDTGMNWYLHFVVVDPVTCHLFYKTTKWVMAVGICVSEMIILLRTWAIWQRDRRIFLILAMISTISYVPGIVVTYMEIQLIHFGNVPTGGFGCSVIKTSNLIIIPYCLLFLSQTVVVILTMLKGKQHLQSSRSSWVKQFYQQGLLFYFLLLTVILVNIITPLSVRSEPYYKSYLASPLRVFHSICSNRVVLHISRGHRLYNNQEQESAPDRSITKSDITGNMFTTVVPSSRPEANRHSEGGTENEHELSIFRRGVTH